MAKSVLWFVFNLLFPIVFIYFISIIFIMLIKNENFQNAKKIADNNIQEIIKFFKSNNVETTSCFNVFIGHNGIYTVEDIINKKFESLYRFYQNWFFNNLYYYSKNVVVYEFRVWDCLYENFNRQTLQYKLRQIAEKALISHFHELGLFNVPIQNFVATSLNADKLLVFIAFNEAGFAEIKELREKAKGC